MRFSGRRDDVSNERNEELTYETLRGRPCSSCFGHMSDPDQNRLLVGLGFLGILIAVRPTVPFPNVTAAVIGVSFYSLILAWGLYALCMLVYFSTEVFGERWRGRAHRIGLILLFSFPVFGVTFAIVLGIAVSTGSPFLTDMTALGAAVWDTLTLFAWTWKIRH